MMLFGIFLRKIGLMDDAFTAKLNQFVFSVALPLLLVKDLGTTDFRTGFDSKFILFCFMATALSIGISVVLSLPFRKSGCRGEFVQVSYRSSAAILGIAFIQNIYGTSRMAPLMILGSVPLYNAAAVIVLAVMKPDRQALDRAFFKKLFRDILTNPIILGIAVGALWSALSIPMPVILNKTLTSISATATPLGLIAMGASFRTDKALSQWKPTVLCTFMKLVGFCSLFLPLAIWAGFTEDKLLSILIMLASPSTVSCFIMAKNMGHEGSLTAGVVMLTTMLGAFTLTAWLFLLKTMGLL